MYYTIIEDKERKKTSMKDFNTYKLNLSKSMEEKLFFLNHININDYDLILDFGCGTGELLNIIAKHLEEGSKAKLIGYDSNASMLYYAIHTCSPKIDFIDSLSNLDILLKHRKRTLIIFSSVLHEMNEFEQRKTLNSIMSQFTTIVIRDMKRPLNNEPISNMTRKRVLAQVAPWQAQIFESRWGKIRDKENLYRFFLMNEFVENFETEVEEDYFGVLWSDIAWRLEGTYNTLYERSYTLPYRKAQVKKRFNHVMHEITHRMVIYNKVEEEEDYE